MCFQNALNGVLLIKLGLCHYHKLVARKSFASVNEEMSENDFGVAENHLAQFIPCFRGKFSSHAHAISNNKYNKLPDWDARLKFSKIRFKVFLD